MKVYGKVKLYSAMINQNEQKIWIVSHAFVCTLLRVYREQGFWFTGFQSWNLVKWNAYGKVMISRKALERFFHDPSLTKSSKARNFGGSGNARCFVAEHIYPSKVLKELALLKWKSKDPSLDEFRNTIEEFNRICYIWFTEDDKLRKIGLRSSLPRDACRLDIFSRYRVAGIDAYETHFAEGRHLFAKLNALRCCGKTASEAMERISI